MKKQDKKKLVLVLALSLVLANHYVEYGKKVKASETEQTMMETESFKEEEILETETEEESETESESESESETEPTSETVPESETELISETVTERETEQPSETMTERESETEIGGETEQLSEETTENESEQLSEEMTESESEQFSEEITESESETEQQIKIIRIFNIDANIPEGGRIYDGTVQVELNYEIEGLEAESGLEVQHQARMAGSDVGEWPVEYQFQLAGEGAEEYELQVEQKEITVTVLPKPLSVIMPDGWKAYGKTAEMKNIYLSGKVQVTGFLKDENGEEQIPKGFELPEIVLDASAVGQWSDIYEDGVQKVYKNVLIMKRTKEGTLTGNPTENYIFSENEEKGEYKKGSLVIAPSEVIQGTDYEVKGEDGACFQAADGTFWVRQGSSFQILPRKDRGYTEGWNSGPVSQGGTLNFTLKKRNKTGEITAVSLEQQAGF